MRDHVEAFNVSARDRIFRHYKTKHASDEASISCSWIIALMYQKNRLNFNMEKNKEFC